MNKNFYGPFFRSSATDKWHWMKDCPGFPHEENPQTMITSSFPDSGMLCKKCTEIEILHSKGDVLITSPSD